MDLKSNEPFWLIKNGNIRSYPSLRKNATTEILVVGGGITGSLIAHQCMEDGYKTMLVDRREIANGSTAATTSMLQYEIDVPLHILIKKIGETAATGSYLACHKAIDDIGKLAKKIRSDCGFTKKKSLYFAACKKDTAGLMQEFESRKHVGLKVRWLNTTQLEKQFKLCHAYGGILSAQGASMDAFRFTHDLLAYNHKRGLMIYDKTAVETPPVYHRNHLLFKTEHGSAIKAKKVIYCTGYESVNLVPEKFVKLLSTYAVVGEELKKKPAHLSDTLFWNTARPYLYFRTTRDNRILIGGEDENFVSAPKRDALLTRKSKKLEKDIQRLLPQQEFLPDFSWTGTFGETKDGLPYIGSHPDMPHSYFVLGFGGNGITFSVTGMEMIAYMLREKQHPLEPYFRFGR